MGHPRTVWRLAPHWDRQMRCVSTQPEAGLWLASVNTWPITGLLLAAYTRNAFADLNVCIKCENANRGLRCDCEIFANLRLTFVWSSTGCPTGEQWTMHCADTGSSRPGAGSRGRGMVNIGYCDLRGNYYNYHNVILGHYEPATGQ